MRKILLFVVSLFFVTSMFFLSSKQTFAGCTSSQIAQNAKVFSQSNGQCFQSSGLGFNTIGGTYVCGPVACPGQSSPAPRGSTCIFPQDKGSGVQCFTGYSTSIYGGFAPSDADGGCKWNDAGNGTPIACPTALNITIKVQNSSGTPLANVPIQFYDNGHGLINYPGGTKSSGEPFLSNSSGIITVSSWSGDHFKAWGVDSSSYTFDKNATHPYDFMVNNTDIPSCGMALASGQQPPCVIVATAAGGGGTTPSPSPSTSPTQQSNKINLALSLMGIGSKGNLSPKHPTRTVHVQIYRKTDDPKQPNITPVADITNATVTFNSNSGYFLNAALSLGSLPTGDYQILVKTPGYLRREVMDNQNNKSFTLTLGQTTTLPAVTLIAGDTAPLYNEILAGDFYAIVDCYKDKASGSTCAAGNTITDLDDNGVIDGVDLNVWLLGMQALQQINFNGETTGDGITGN